jgi:hypothetical protein
MRLKRGDGVRLAAQAVPYAAAIIYAIAVAGHGIPALRHDWSWPADRGALPDFFTRSTSGWDPRGIGSPNLYINDYLIAIVITSMTFVLGSHAALFVFMAAIGTACAAGGAAIARRFGAGATGQAAVSLIALFNPWVYAETVAGHTYMLLAYGSLMALIAEYRREQVRPVVASLFAILTMQQLQFFVVAFVATVITAARRKQWLPLASVLIAAVPAIAGVIFEFSAYRGVPYALAWESVQSVDPAKAFLLTGYFAGYTQRIDFIDWWVMLVVAGLSLYGFASIARSRWGAGFAIVTAALVALAMGFRGPLAGVERFAIAKLPESLLFRELYDLLGLAAIGYCAGVGASTRRAAAGYVALAAGLALAAGWVLWSPWQWWVSTADLPTPNIAAPPDTRYALTPAFQPLSRVPGATGSGLDPDAVLMPDDVRPVNSMQPAYPVDAALARFEKRGDVVGLAALGVSEVVSRPWLTTDTAALAAQRALPPPLNNAPGAAVIRRLEPQPQLALMQTPLTCSVCTRAGGAVFFGDVAGINDALAPAAWSGYPQTVIVQPSREAVHARDGWVDARLAFASNPELAQAFGGAVTTSKDASLPVMGGLDALVLVQGRLLTSSGAVVTGTTNGYRWVPLGADVSALRCDGLCAVALESPQSRAFPAETGAAGRQVPLSLRRPLPWLVTADVPAGDAAMLRFNEAYDNGWIARLTGARLPHFRVDAIVNGWLVPARTSSDTITIVHWPSFVVAILEAIGCLWTAALIIALMAAMRNRSAQSAFAP